MKNADMPAMPMEFTGCGRYEPERFTGLTKREMFAMHIMAGFAVDPDIDVELIPEVAKGAVRLADALLAELGGKK